MDWDPVCLTKFKLLSLIQVMCNQMKMGNYTFIFLYIFFTLSKKNNHLLLNYIKWISNPLLHFCVRVDRLESWLIMVNDRLDLKAWPVNFKMPQHKNTHEWTMKSINDKSSVNQFLANEKGIHGLQRTSILDDINYSDWWKRLIKSIHFFLQQFKNDVHF